MKNFTTLLTALWADDCGLVLSSEIVLVGTVAVLGIMTGLVCVRDAVNDELAEVGDAFRSIDQSYSYGGMHGCTSRCGLSSYTSGSSYGNIRQASYSRVIDTDLGCRPCEIEEVREIEQVRQPAAGTYSVPQHIESVPCPMTGPVMNEACPTPACPPQGNPVQQERLIW